MQPENGHCREVNYVCNWVFTSSKRCVNTKNVLALPFWFEMLIYDGLNSFLQTLVTLVEVKLCCLIELKEVQQEAKGLGGHEVQ